MEEKGTKFLMIVLIMFAGVGGQFVFDLFQGLAPPMYSYFEITTSQFQRIYSLYCFLNFFFAPVGGLIATKIGLGLATVLFSVMIFIGLFIANFGVYIKNWNIVMLGWAIFGCGTESAINTQVANIERWFTGPSLSFAIGLKFSFSLATGSLSDYICPEIYEKYRSLQVPFFVASLVATLGVISAISYFLIDSKKAKLYLDLTSDTNKKNYKFRMADLGNMGFRFWLILSAYSFFPHIYLQFAHFLTDMAQRKYHYPYLEAKNFMAELKLLFMFGIPTVSFIVSKAG